jgi:hypothetical protein
MRQILWAASPLFAAPFLSSHLLSMANFSAANNQANDHWTTGNDSTCAHISKIDAGAMGEVHKVLLFSAHL